MRRIRSLVRRLLAVWHTADHAARLEGRRWYAHARRHARRLAKLHGVTLRTAAGVIAALSPRLHWTANVRAADKLLGSEDVPGVFMASLRKGQAIFAGAAPLAVLSGPKVRAFYRAIMGDGSAAVVDVWVARAAGVPDALSARTYAEVASALGLAAATVGVPTATFQATTWCAARGRA